MDMIIVLGIVIYGYVMYKLGKYVVHRQVGEKVAQSIIAKAYIPIGVIENIDNMYYVYEKDTSNFLGQATTLEELPKKLLANKISIALLMYPEQSPEVYWCINGKLKVKNEG